VAERRTLEVGALARVEGEGALHLTVEGDRVIDLRLEIYEPPRFFEAFCRGRRGEELPDLLARICGICPVAYQMSAVHALERAWGVEVPPAVRALRRLYYAGEWIESHVLHMVFLAVPDYLGVDDVTEVARRARGEVERALRVRQAGNRILRLLGGRPVNPVGVRVGGFHRLPTRGETAALAEELLRARADAEALLEWIASLPVPRRPRDVELVSLRHPSEYPMNEGRLVSSAGLDVADTDFDTAFEEIQVPHSTALHCRVRERGLYQVGPLARVLLNAEKLAPAARAAHESLADRFVAPDPAASVFARGLEVLHALEEARTLAEGWEPPGPEAEHPAVPRAGSGAAATEAPRGVLYVAVETDPNGDVTYLRVVPPTSQNQAAIEDDLRELAPRALALPHPEARRTCEAAIRDYDPCISCATHFLRLHVERRQPPCASD